MSEFRKRPRPCRRAGQRRRRNRRREPGQRAGQALRGGRAPDGPHIGSRVAIWAVAQLHLLFAAFVLAVPIFAFIVEAIGYKTGDVLRPARARVHEAFSVSFSLTATFGAFLTFMLIILIRSSRTT